MENAGGGDKMVERAVNAILISAADDVATVITELSAGDQAIFLKAGKLTQVPVVGTIPQYHKLALRDIAMNEPIRKYGEIIGQATKDIPLGSHVHDHNTVSPE